MKIINNMEIKVGDKVRVSKDAPEMYFFGCNYDNSVCKVILVDRDNALITQVKNGSFAIPTKYLTKVEDEAKEPKFKVGDKVRKKKWDKDTTISYVEWHGTWQTYVYRFAEQEYGFNCHKEEDITLVSRRAKEPKFKTGDCVKTSFEWNDLPIGKKLVIKRLETIDCRNAYMYSIEGYGGCVIESMLHPYTKPKEQTEETSPNVNHSDIDIDTIVARGYIPDPNSFFKCDWDAYTADLAKEIAVKLSDPNENKPGYVADYAVSVAKAVVENLKRK